MSNTASPYIWEHSPDYHQFVCPGCKELHAINDQIQFLPDCSHALAGQTVPMIDFETWVMERWGLSHSDFIAAYTKK